MKNLAMYMLLKLAGKEPTAEMVEESLKACEIEANNEICEEIVSKMEGKNYEEVIAEGKSKMATMTAAAAPVAAAAEDKPAEEEKKEKTEEDEIIGGFGFGDSSSSDDESSS